MSGPTPRERCPRAPTASTCSRAKSGFARRPCATRFSSWPRRRADSHVSCCLASCLTARATRFTSSVSKDKLGNRSNASSEIALDGAWAVMVGEEGRGVRTIIEMVNHTRLDCVIGSASLMRQAVAQATHHAAHRSAFGKLLSEQPLMTNVLADLAVESEATTILMMRLAGAFDRAADPAEAHFKRIGLAVAKFWTCKRAIGVVAEALECHGGNGYVEESILPRLYREVPLNSIWEGSGNVDALDVLRAMQREPDSLAAYFEEVLSAPHDSRLQRALDRLKGEIADPEDLEPRARGLAERMAVTLQA